MLCPDLVEIGAGVELLSGVNVVGAAVYGGRMHFAAVKVGAGCKVEPDVFLTPGTTLEARCIVPPMMATAGCLGGTAEALALRANSDAAAFSQEFLEFEARQGLLRMFLGVPWICTLQSLAHLLVLAVLHSVWQNVEGMLGDWRTFFAFWYVLVPSLYVHGSSFALIVLVVMQKRFMIGRLRPGMRLGPPVRRGLDDNVFAWSRAHWDSLRHWIHERTVTGHAFEHALDPMVSTELMSVVHRLLGAKVGRRVQSDNFQAVEHDCIEIEDFVVFGSSVHIHCDTDVDADADADARGSYRHHGSRVLRPVRILHTANCLDHTSVEPGAVLGEGAVLGSMTLAQKDACFPPDSVSTGAVGGRSMLLRLDASASAPAPERRLELQVMRQLDSPVVWTVFNLVQLSSAYVAYILPHLSWVVASDFTWRVSEAILAASGLQFKGEVVGSSTVGDDTVAQQPSLLVCLFVIWMAVFSAMEVLFLLTTVALKWSMIGRFKEGNFAFFSGMHVRWSIMMNVKGAMSPLAEQLQGTIFQNWYYRLMGAKIGRNAYIAGLALEYDLLEVGDNAAVNEDCDTTAHTVERMVLKMAPVQIERDCAMLAGSIVMPGGRMEKGSLLLERSQVLKGDVVRSGDCWAGLPARRIDGISLVTDSCAVSVASRNP